MTHAVEREGCCLRGRTEGNDTRVLDEKLYNLDAAESCF